MNERQANPTDDTVRKQRLSGHPQKSVWVSANAGSGKTYVLTTRVLRLLLTGLAPESILCLTYTKAAAAEMRARISASLGAWAVMDAEKLEAELQEIEGRAASETELLRARTLFARALETPGGLKINTIHAFCESLLHRFPLEAGVPFNFEVIEDSAQADLVRRAREAVFADGLDGHGAIAAAVETLFAHLGDAQIDSAINEALAQIRKLRPILADLPGAKARLRAAVGHNEKDSVSELERRLSAETVLSSGDAQTLIALLDGGSSKTRFVDQLAAAQNPEMLSVAERLDAFLTKKEGRPPRAKLFTKSFGVTEPVLVARFEAERDRVHSLHQSILAAQLVERSEAMLDTLAAIIGEYERRKRINAYLDFNDLIASATALLRDREQSQWVRYKLDAGITHILVDESQDTNDEQWQVIDALADEFFDGQGAVERQRSIFAVGDPKQSIFSFQGAEPELFIATGQRYRVKAGAVEAAFESVRLTTSFRTVPAILEAVDKTFAAPQFADALLLANQPPEHESARVHRGGRVALWPVLRQEPVEYDARSWPMLEHVETTKSAPRQNAERIAQAIRCWLDAGRALGERQRPIRPDDILILVQSRGPLFREVIRALKQAGIPSPGADRLAVGSHIAILDLLALGDVLLNTNDDLGLAALLRSPLFDVSENDLFEIAHLRHGTLWDALANSGNISARGAFGRLSHWRNRLDFDRPYEFYAHMLYAGGGLRRFHARLGGEVDDVVTEFLDLALAHERSAQPSLQGFLAEMRERDISIKRDLSEAGNGVRVMTVHGAKGLEAPIVILADAATKPSGSQTTKPVYFKQTPEGPYFVHAGSTGQHVVATLPLRAAEQAVQADEYWRKLYVAMTRAEDELHIAGVLTKDGKLEETWFEAVSNAIEGECAEREIAPGLSVKLYPQSTPEDTFLPSTSTADPVAVVPGWSPLPEPLKRTNLRPSEMTGSGDSEDPLRSAAEAVRDADVARREGVALHALLQHLGNVPKAQRQQVGQAALTQLLAGHPDESGRLVARAIEIIEAPELGMLFSQNSRAEVPILAHGFDGLSPVRIVGRIDRLIIEPGRVLIVDYKSDVRPAASLPPAYLFQLGLYAAVLRRLFPDAEIQAAILWTANKTLSYASPEDLTRAIEGISIL